MTREEQILRLKAILSEHEIEDDITEATRMKEDLEMDSLTYVDIVFDILTHFGVKLEASEMAKHETVGELLDYIMAKKEEANKTA